MTFTEEREKMVEAQLKRRGIKNALILEAMRAVPRHDFVPPAHAETAYYDGPLPIGSGQTISQPYMVAVMTEALLLRGGEKVLEIGTGSGYQAAVLSRIAGEVCTVERHPALADEAEKRIKLMGYDNVRVFTGDGTLGLAGEAPFDCIVVTAGAPHIPARLKEQLSDGGRLVIPVGGRFMQSLLRVMRNGDTYDEEDLLGCVFVPLIGEDGWEEG